MQRIDDLAVDIELELTGGAVSDPYRLGALVARQPRQFELDQASLPRDAVHDLDVLGIAGDRTQQPVPPGARFVDVARSQECEQRQRGVPQPAVPVVPVADTAERFRQRGRRGGDDPSGRRIRERLQREERPAHGLRPAPGGRAAADPFLPVVDGLLESVLGIHGFWQRLVRGSPGQDERDTVALLDRELRVRAEIPALEIDWRSHRDRVRAGDGDERFVDRSNPRDDGAVVETEHQLHEHVHASVDALHDADDIGGLAARRHEVDQAHGARTRLELGLQHERVAPIAAPGRVELALGLDRPVPVLGVAEQRGEDRPRVEARQAEPVDAAVTADERGGLEIADQSVVLDAGHYSPSSRNDAKRRKRFSAARLKASRYSSAVGSSSVPAYVSLIS